LGAAADPGRRLVVRAPWETEHVAHKTIDAALRRERVLAKIRFNRARIGPKRVEHLLMIEKSDHERPSKPRFLRFVLFRLEIVDQDRLVANLSGQRRERTFPRHTFRHAHLRHHGRPLARKKELSSHRNTEDAGIPRASRATRLLKT